MDDFKDQPAYQRAMREIERRSVAMAQPGVEQGLPDEDDLPSGDGPPVG